MTDINFYVSKNEGVDYRLKVLYRLVILAMQRDFTVYIHAENPADCKLIDDYLWRNEKSSFIPHTTLLRNTEGTQSAELSVVNITCDVEPTENCDYLINMTSQRPNFFSRFLKVAEIIDTSEELLTSGRKRYAFYRDRGYNLNYHQL